jgi:hypothetical protein
VLALLGVDVALVVARVISYPFFLRQSGSGLYLAEPLLLLAIYTAVALAVARAPGLHRWRVLRAAAVVAIALGAIEVANISVETVADLSGTASLATTAPLILGPFAVWSLVAGWAARVTGSLRMGLLAAVWTAMVTMVIAVTYGFVLLLAAPNRLARNLLTDPDYARSGWPDIKAFALANTFDNGFTHLLGGLLVGSIVGLIGGLVGVRLSESGTPAGSDRSDRSPSV